MTIKTTLPDDLLAEMAELLPDEERDEMGIPSYRHKKPMLRWMAWKRVTTLVSMIEDWAARQKTDPAGMAALDYGCGSGVVLKPMSQMFGKVYGLDIVLDAVKLTINRFDLKNVELIGPDGLAEVEDSSLDLVVCGEVLEHIDDLAPILRRIKAKLKPEGALLASLPMENALYKLGRRLAGFSGHYHLKGAKQIHADILANNFKAGRSKRIPLPGPFTIYWLIEYRPI